MKSIEIMNISNLCLSYGLGIMKNRIISPTSFRSELFEDLGEIYDQDIGASWAMVLEALEEREWVVRIFENNCMVTDRWGK